MPEEIYLHTLPRAEQQQVIEKFINRRRDKLINEYPNVIDISYGINCRGGSLTNKKGLVLKFWVRKKTKKPRHAIPPVFKCRYKVRLSSGKPSRPATILVPTDVLPVAKGKVFSKSAKIRCSYNKKGVRGCLTARVRWQDDRYAWLSAAHVLSAFLVSRRSDAIGTVRCSGREIGRTIPDTCWCIDYETNLKVDAGLVEEEKDGPIDPEWIAGNLSKYLPVNEISTGVGYRFVDQDNNEIDIDWHCLVPGAVHSFEIAPGVLRKYPRFLHFSGNSRPGDSGAPVYKKKGRARLLIGILLGEISISGINGIAVLPFRDVVDALDLKNDYTVELLPFVI